MTSRAVSRQRMQRTLASLFVTFAFTAGMTGCARQPTDCRDDRDNPGRLYVNAMESIERGAYDNADIGLSRALHCAPDFYVALSARALVTALRAARNTEHARSTELREAAYADLDAGAAGVESAEERFLHSVTAIRTLTALADGDWLPRAQAIYESARDLRLEESALLYYEQPEALPYYMGNAFASAGRYEPARAMYAEVFQQRGVGRWNAAAEAEWQRVDKVVRATAGITAHGIGRRLASQATVTRADIATLLVEEVRLGELLETTSGPEFIPADIAGEPEQANIIAMLSWRLRGLEPVYDATSRAYLFKPNAAVRRMELAIALEDVVIRMTGDQTLARAFVGHQQSLFADVAPTAAWYNACATAVSRGFMESDLEGAFRPDENVAGADALLAARALRQKMARR